MVSTGETLIYSQWLSKLNVTALSHFQNPTEVFSTTSYRFIAIFIAFIVGSTYLFNKLYTWLFKSKTISLFHTRNSFLDNVFLLVRVIFFVFVAVVSIRGGLQPFPIQSSDAYFSKYPLANDIAVNPFWNIVHQLLESNGQLDSDKFISFNDKAANEIMTNTHFRSGFSDQSLLSNKKPNIVIILLESWSANLSKSFGGETSFTPFLDSLVGDGLSFTNIYASGHVSDQGIPAVLSGYPALSQMSIANYNEKSQKLNSINKHLSKIGYQDFILFGGDLTYGNIKSYVYNMDFDVIKEEGDFIGDIEIGRLGVQDISMQAELLNQMNITQQPFFGVWFTLSSHMPYDYVGVKEPLVDHRENDYVNSVKYSDACLRQFFMDAKRQAWFDSTMFIFVSDHSHITHLPYNNYSAPYHKIPMLWYGSVINKEFRGKNIDVVGSQIDIAKTLENQLGLVDDARQFELGNDLLSNDHPQHAYYCSFDGYGMVVKDGAVGYKFGQKDPVYSSGKINVDSVTTIMRAFQQYIFKDFKNK
ncbi:MAG: LTA synthase family protein [Saprospiraceae bacterium]